MGLIGYKFLFHPHARPTIFIVISLSVTLNISNLHIKWLQQQVIWLLSCLHFSQKYKLAFEIPMADENTALQTSWWAFFSLFPKEGILLWWDLHLQLHQSIPGNTCTQQYTLIFSGSGVCITGNLTKFCSLFFQYSTVFFNLWLWKLLMNSLTYSGKSVNHTIHESWIWPEL